MTFRVHNAILTSETSEVGQNRTERRGWHLPLPRPGQLRLFTCPAPGAPESVASCSLSPSPPRPRPFHCDSRSISDAARSLRTPARPHLPDVPLGHRVPDKLASGPELSRSFSSQLLRIPERTTQTLPRCEDARFRGEMHFGTRDTGPSPSRRGSHSCLTGPFLPLSSAQSAETRTSAGETDLFY